MLGRPSSGEESCAPEILNPSLQEVASQTAVAVSPDPTLQWSPPLRLLRARGACAKQDHRSTRAPLAEFELRVGSFRVLYNVEGEEVILLVVGLKVGNRLIVGGEEFYGHQGDPSEPARGGSGGDAV